jgi:hypothetical protein
MDCPRKTEPSANTRIAGAGEDAARLAIVKSAPNRRGTRKTGAKLLPFSELSHSNTKTADSPCRWNYNNPDKI